MCSKRQNPHPGDDGVLQASSLLRERVESREDGCVGSRPGTLAATRDPQSLPTLPIELENIIIGHLHGDIAALKAASLVCRDWTRAAHRYLFHTIKLTGLNQLLRFAEDFPLIPDIRESVQVVILHGEEDHSMAAPQPLPTYVNFVIGTVASMPRLRDLHFVDVPMRFRRYAINPPLRSSLRRLTFELNNCFPEDFQCMLNIVGLFSSIASLEFSILDTPMAIQDQFMPSPEDLFKAGALPSYGPVEIHSLKIPGLDHHWLPLLLCTLRHVGALQDAALEVDISHNIMRKTDVDFETEARLLLEGYGTFFRGLGPALRVLDFDLLYTIVAAHEELNGNWAALGLSACTNLQYLRLYLDVPSDLEDAHSTLSAVLHAYVEILTANRFPALRYVALPVLADGYDLVCDLDWSSLASAPLALPALVKFVLHMRCSRPRPPMAGRYLDDMARLQRAGKFIVFCATPIPVEHPEAIAESSGGGDVGSDDGDEGEAEDEADGSSTLNAGSYGEPADDGVAKSDGPE
ncbi:hypothetical protein LXA43DRAFT_229125 [Ganoderma leucocontextum]|nr:hypothetical protein LXA43DRAFT_229125 [Ganoderma leucocontextum]